MTDPQAGSRSERLDRAIHTLLSQTPEIEAAAVVSFDGLPMAAALPPSMDEDRVAAMSAALLSLGERAAQGLGRGELSQVFIEGDAGTVFLISADDEAVLVAVASKGAKVGMMLYEVKRTAALVAEVLRAEDAPFVPELTWSQPVPAQPVPAQAVPAEPVYAQPVPAEPVPAQAVPAEPVYAQAGPDQPEYAEPVYATAASDPLQLADPAWTSSYIPTASATPTGYLPPATWS